jgi:hypothetical protein
MQWDIIPQVSYDLIARIVPGAAVIFIVFCLFVIPTVLDGPLMQWIEGGGVLLLLVAFLLSYLAGRLLAEIWEIGRRCFGTRFGRKLMNRIGKGAEWIHDCIFDESQHRPYAKGKVDTPDCESWSGRIAEYKDLSAMLNTSSPLPCSQVVLGRHILHDHLRLYAPADAFRLLKIHAEERMFESLSVGLVLVLLTDLAYWGGDRYLLRLILLVTTFLCWRGARRSKRYYLMAVQRAWLLHNYPLGAAKKTITADALLHN